MTSGEINVKLQSDDENDMETEDPRPQTSQFIENQYVKVFGIIKSLQNQKVVQAFRMLPIKELNEITHHLLECMSASIYYTSKANGEGLDMQIGNPLKNSNLNGTSYGDNGGSSLSTGGLSGIFLNV